MAYQGQPLPLSPQVSHSEMHASPDPRYLRPHKTSSSSQAMPDLEQVRSRERSYAQQDGYASDSSRYSQSARKPVIEAINSAFSTQSSNTAALPPEVLEQLTSQITANVIQQLNSRNLGAQKPTPTSQPHTDANSSAGASPRVDRAQVYTPPSPYRPHEDGHGQTSPARSNHSAQNSREQTSPPLDQRPTSPYSQSSRVDDLERSQDNFKRPQPPQRVSTGGDFTTIEKIWGRLFDKQGTATARLGQFLRGIAIHLIEDYEPKSSLVVTPAKMQKYYEETLLANEIYPWQVIFDDRTSSISRMYRDIECQHHLVQEKLSERPDLPGLTPQGFEAWATLLIKAHPDQEFERLAKTVYGMPINNADDVKERFPKELSRRLLPKDPDVAAAAKLQRAMTKHCNVKFPSRHDSTNSVPAAIPVASNESASQPSLSKFTTAQDENVITPVTSRPESSFTSSNADPRPVVTDTPHGVAVESEDEAPTPQPIERERKPYVAQVGGGKTYDTEDSVLAEVKPGMPEPKLTRSTSSSGNNGEYYKPRPAPITVHHNADTSGQPTSAPIDIPESRHRRTKSYHKDPTSASASGPRRTRSPSIHKDRGYGRQTDPNFSQSYASGGGASYTSRSDLDNPEKERRYRDYETNRERHAGDRYDAGRMAAYDPRDRDRERDSRPRGQSIAVPYDDARGGPVRGTNEDEYYRGLSGYPTPHHGARDGYGQSIPSGPQYPPSSYRDSR